MLRKQVLQRCEIISFIKICFLSFRNRRQGHIMVKVRIENSAKIKEKKKNAEYKLTVHYLLAVQVP